MAELQSDGQHALDNSRARVVLAVTAAMIATSTVFVSFRMVSRIGVVKKVSLDDYFILLAWLIALGLSLSICIGTHYGIGLHDTDIADSSRPALVRLQYTFSVLYNPALMATKTSILVFYLSLAKSMKVFKWSSVAVLAVVNVAGAALSLLNFFQCTPLSAIFETPHPDSSTCVDVVTLYLSSAPLNIATDLCILLLPMPVLKSMRLPRKQKLILYITFGFGVFVAAVDVVRISYLQGASLARLQGVQQGSSSSSDTARNREELGSDFSWSVSLVFMWSAIEVNVGIMCACVPALKPLVSKFMPKLLKDTSATAEYPRVSSHRAGNPSVDLAPDQQRPSPQSISPTTPNPPAPARVNDSSDGPMGMVDFLTTPDMSELPANLQPQDTTHTSPRPIFFDFVNIGEMKSIVNLSTREALRPVAEVTLVFFLWGFAYGLLGTLNSQFQIVAGMSTGQTIGIHSIYYVGYFVAPLTFGRLILKNWGFKSCVVIGLVIYGVGTLVFWPAAVLTSFPAFLVSNFIIGLGLATLEIAANPFIALCGPPEYAEIRLNLSQGVQAIGTVISPLIAKKALFNDLAGDAPSLLDVQWTYLAIALFVFVLAFVYYVIKVPEVTDDELEVVAYDTHPEHLDSLRQSHIIWITLGLAVFCQFGYVGSQEATATSLANYVNTLSPPGSSPPDYVNYEAVGHSLFAASRFLSAGMGIWIKPRHQLAFWYFGLLIFSALAMQFSGFASGAMVMCVYFFEGPIFALIFAMALRGLGKWTRDGSALLTAAISGGAVVPAILHAVAQNSGSYKYSYCVIVAVYAFGAVFPIYLNILNRPKVQVDPTRRFGEPRRYSSSRMTSGLRRFSQISASALRRRSLKKQHDSEQTSTEAPVVEQKERSEGWA